MEVNISKIATNPVGAAKGSQSNTASDEDLLANSKNVRQLVLVWPLPSDTKVHVYSL